MLLTAANIPKIPLRRKTEIPRPGLAQFSKTIIIKIEDKYKKATGFWRKKVHVQSMWLRKTIFSEHHAEAGLHGCPLIRTQKGMVTAMDQRMEQAFLRWMNASLEDPDLVRDLESIRGRAHALSQAGIGQVQQPGRSVCRPEVGSALRWSDGTVERAAPGYGSESARRGVIAADMQT